jgi:uncharacterized lipoprotein YajG
LPEAESNLALFFILIINLTVNLAVQQKKMMMKTVQILAAMLLVFMFTACNNTPNENTAAEAITTEDSVAFDVKVESENLQQQAEELDQEVDSLINSIK